MMRATSARGAAAVEFAIVLPLLLTILFGTIEWGYYFFNRQIVVNAAREGARTGTLMGASTTAATDATKKYLTNAGLPLTRDGISVADVYDDVTLTGGTCDTISSSCILVKYKLPTMTGFLDAFLGSTRTIVAYAEMRK